MSLEGSSAAFIKKFEGYSSKAYWDVNAWRIGFGSGTTELANGTHRKVVSSDVTTKDLAQKDLSRRLSEEFIPNAKNRIGEPYWSKLPEKAQVALISLEYNYGSINKQAIIDAARSGDLNKLSQAIVDSTYNDNKNLSAQVREQLRDRRAQEADMVKSAIEASIEFAKRNKWPIIMIGAGLTGLAIVVSIYAYKRAA